MKTMIAFFALMSGLFLSRTAASAVDPSLHWRRASSAHFDLIYDAQQQELADLYLNRLERAWQKLGRLWPNRPERLTIVINDRTDLTNGYATALPYAHVVVFPVLPGPLESISEYGDWAEEILLHELTHVLSFEQRRGTVQTLSNIFGTIITPNLLLPTWVLEGVAVDAETRLSRHGRLRSTFQDATLRSLVSDRTTWDQRELTEINQFDIPHWPYGARPYLFGSLMWSEMIALKGERMISELHESFGGRFPWLLSAPVEERFDGDSFVEIFEKTKKSVATAVEKQRQTLGTVPFSTYEILRDPQLRESLTPRISPDGLKLAFIAKDDTLKRSIQMLVRPDLKTSFSAAHRVKTFGQKQEVTTPVGTDIKLPRAQPDGPPTGTINRVSWTPDSKSFVFDLVREETIFRDQSDLWIFHADGTKAERLTKGLRAREPDVRGDGQAIAFVKIEQGRTSLALWDLKQKSESILFRPEMMERVSWPLWLDDNRILFGLRTQGQDKFAVYNLQSRQLSWPANLPENVSLPFRKKDRLFFVSQESGVRNVYETDAQFKSSRPVTHLWTGAYASDYDDSRDEWWVTQIGRDGFELARTTRLPATVTKLPKVGPLLGDRYPLAAPEPPTETGTVDTADYSALPYLRPRYWLPSVYWDDKGTQVSASTGGFDPLQKHAYSLFGRYDSAIRRGSYIVGYQNQSFRPTLGLTSAELNSYLADPDQITRLQWTHATAKWQIASIDPDLFAGIGFNWLAREQESSKSYQLGPDLSLSYGSVSQTGEQISPEAGWLGAVTTTQFLAGADRETYNLTALALTKYGKIPWGSHHAWMARFAGQTIDRDVSRANYDSTISSLAAATPTPQVYLMRGYSTGAFFGKSLGNLNLEYRFPLRRLDRGTNKFAFYGKRLSAAVVGDAIMIDGEVYDTTLDIDRYREAERGRVYGSGGVELKFDVTLGYHFNLQLVAGLYAPFAHDVADSSPRLGFGLAL